MAGALHVFRQGSVIASLASTAAAAAKTRPTEPIVTPSEPILATVKPRAASLIRDYVRASGGNPKWYRDTVPAHLFPQWGFPLLSKTLADVPYDLTKVLNAGCHLKINAPLPADAPLHLRATLEHIDDDGYRALITQRLVTGTDAHPDAVVAEMNAFVPLKKRDGKRKEKPMVPLQSTELAQWRFGKWAGLEFATLTGDFNPVHWVPPYARAAGFKSVILHGFATFARTIETLNRVRFSGVPDQLAEAQVRFVRPLTLPARAKLYVGPSDGAAPVSFAVGSAAGGPASAIGTFTVRES